MKETKTCRDTSNHRNKTMWESHLSNQTTNWSLTLQLRLVAPADVLSHQFSSVFTQEQVTPCLAKEPPPYPHLHRITITRNGVEYLLQKVKSKKASGPDLIQAHFLHEMAIKATEWCTVLHLSAVTWLRNSTQWLENCQRGTNLLKKGWLWTGLKLPLGIPMPHSAIL